MRVELGGATSGSCDLVPLNSKSRHTALDARTMNHAQSCASTARAERSRTRSPAESMKLTADRSSSAVTPSARARAYKQEGARSSRAPPILWSPLRALREPVREAGELVGWRFATRSLSSLAGWQIGRAHV